ncbi:Methanogenic corrinoid protein MtbC1 [Thermanaeromonas toyohensis ToBE]|uniref:Methanogenic corrinoid protein MtbC1 n=1 Tax=Thermanaeromonas toyohensis ToBE TaxID=698762 RepID=A0A1W1VPF6_9FIRM|nr:cobalamin-dependent protein [Thermanaeromonas toyohensis]SMB94951.1 Methanogenic corrinoid protein MtbC1 [Thermanaeromonas toyohensis ToBE]
MTLLGQLLADLQEEKVLNEVRAQLAAGKDPLQIIEECRQGMQLVGERFEQKEYFVSDLVMSAAIFSQVTELIAPHLKGEAGGPKGKVVIGTAKGDIHDIGKNIVIAMLQCHGYEVIDLGVDVEPQKFVDAVRESGAGIVGISCLLTVAFPALKETVDAFVEAGIRDRVKIMIGGAPVNEKVKEYAGADAVGRDAMAAVNLAREFLKVFSK